MLILSLPNMSNPNGPKYVSGPVFTTVAGSRVMVSAGYSSRDISGICAQAYLNASVRALLTSYARKVQVPR